MNGAGDRGEREDFDGRGEDGFAPRVQEIFQPAHLSRALEGDDHRRHVLRFVGFPEEFQADFPVEPVAFFGVAGAARGDGVFPGVPGGVDVLEFAGQGFVFSPDVPRALLPPRPRHDVVAVELVDLPADPAPCAGLVVPVEHFQPGPGRVGRHAGKAEQSNDAGQRKAQKL